MPLPSLAYTQSHVDKEIAKLEAVLEELDNTSAVTKFLVAEIIVIRAASILETALAEVAYKVVAGGIYLDGTNPNLLHQSRSMAGARAAMLQIGRRKPRQFLKWTRANYIVDSVANVIDSADNYVDVCNHFGSNIAQIFKVRNFAAHRNTSTRNEFNSVVRLVYGRKRKMQLGHFLLSRNFVPKNNISRYLVEIRVIVNDLTKK